jgi:hypothetical protein
MAPQSRGRDRGVPGCQVRFITEDAKNTEHTKMPAAHHREKQAVS